MTAALALKSQDLHPLETVEQIASRYEWMVDRSADDEINMIVSGTWTDLHLALNWNMGEEVGPWQKHPKTTPQLTPQRLTMAEYFHQNDPYHHLVVVHNGMPFDDILGPSSRYTGV